MSADALAVAPAPGPLTPSVLGALAGVAATPRYNRQALTGGIVHLGIGAFHRAHLAVYVHDLLQCSNGTWSVTGSGVTAHDGRMADALQRQDGLYTLIERDGGAAKATIVGSIGDLLPAAADASALLVRLAHPSTRIVSLTITEGGYPVEHGTFVETDALRSDAIVDVPTSTFGVIAAALDARRRAGLAPFTVLSCDNLPGNGAVSRTAVLGAAAMRSAELEQWVAAHGAFPNAMVDRITPVTSDADRRWVADNLGVSDAVPVVCEPFRQWALEDHFTLGRPAFEEVGVLMTADVVPYEHMKLRLLNASHSALAYLAALASIELVHDAVADVRIERFIRALMADEAAPNLAVPAGVDLVDYQETLVRRFSNPAIGDQVARLCLDGTAKFPIFLVPSIDAQLGRGAAVRMLALALAGWCRYLQGVADDGSAIVLARDPNLGEAVTFARRDALEPGSFLHFTRALGPALGSSERLRNEFVAAGESLARIGSLATLERWVR